MFKTIILPILVIAGAGWLYWFWNNDPMPSLDPEEWWGPRQLKDVKDVTIRPFKVEFSEKMIADLKHRLANFRAPRPSPEGTAFQHGFNSLQLDHWRQYWAEKYNFTEREMFLNQFPQFKTNVQGLDVHFIRVRPEAPLGVEVVPLLILHGWPGSVREFYELIPLLTKDDTREFSFEVIVPSLPGFGFSDAPARPGLGGPQIATLLINLMQRLGHKQFYLQGGDFGAVIASDLVTLYPERVLGYHTNFPVVKHPLAFALTALTTVFPSLLAHPDRMDRTNPLDFWVSRAGYVYLQSTKPDVINPALSDSPLGLLAYTLDKFSWSTNPRYTERADGGLLEKFSREQLLDNLMMYWFGGSAARIYADGMSQMLRRWRLQIKPTPVPVWVLQAKYEVVYQIPTAIRFKYPNLLNVTVLPKGGHFIAFEEPEALAEDLFTAVKAFREYNKKL